MHFVSMLLLFSVVDSCKTYTFAAPHYKPSKEYILFDWLRSKGLDHYFVSFIQSELVDLVDIARLNLPNEQLYDELEITLPGHKRRFERAGAYMVLSEDFSLMDQILFFRPHLFEVPSFLILSSG